MVKVMNTRMLVVALLLLAFFLIFASGCIKTLHGSGQIIFIPIGSNISKSQLRELADYYKDKYGIKIKIQPNLEIPSGTYDPGRNQLVAEDIVASLVSKFRKPDEKSRTILIGITNQDMYIRRMVDWRYAFSYRDPIIGGAVVSSARMNDAFFGGPNTSHARRKSRLIKMISKSIGILYYGLPESPDPRSVMFNNVMGPSDLDRMGEDF